MNLIIIGASSFIGRRIFELANEQGIHVIGTQSKKKEPAFYPFDLMNDNINDFLQKFDLNLQRTCAVITAYYTGHERIFKNSAESRRINIDKLKNVLTDLNQLKIKTLYFSSEQVFDGLDRSRYNEGSLKSPVLTYGRHKAELDDFILETLPEVLIYRLSQVIGDHPQGNHIWKDIYDCHIKGQTVKCIKGQIFCPTYVNDIAKYSIEGLKLGLKGLYHVANPESMSRFMLSKKLLDALHSNVGIEEVDQSYFGFSEARPMDTSLDCSKFYNMTSANFVSMDVLSKLFIKNLK